MANGITASIQSTSVVCMNKQNVNKISYHKQVEYDRPGERKSRIGLLLLTVTDVSTTWR